MLTSTGPASSIGANLPASSAVGASSQSITAPRSSSAPTPTSPSNFSKSPSTAAASSTLTNRVGSGSTSPPPAEPLPSLPRSSLSRASSESSRQAGGRSTSSPSSTRHQRRMRCLLLVPIPQLILEPRHHPHSGLHPPSYLLQVCGDLEMKDLQIKRRARILRGLPGRDRNGPHRPSRPRLYNHTHHLSLPRTRPHPPSQHQQ
ncbi:hypothetical protein EDB83DRAFT_1504567 [Lactarius deliciosus]|nr:hypothetical protein EDB83DRAFT_1504567 [Lactarius deliciosus]